MQTDLSLHMTDIQIFNEENEVENQNTDIVEQTIDTCALYCENYLKQAPDNLSYPTTTSTSRFKSPHFGFESFTEVSTPDVKFKDFCEYCWHFKNYTHFECKYFKMRGRVTKWLNRQTPSKKCVVCANFGSECPLLQLDRHLLKRLFTSFGIKLHVSDDGNKQPEEQKFIS